MKKNQNGFSVIFLSLILVVSLLIVMIGLTLTRRGETIRKVGTNTANPVESSSQDGTVIFGIASVTLQGPTDAPIGEEPAEATLLIGTEESVRQALQPVKTPDGFIVSYSAAEAGMRSNALRLLSTSKGDYEFNLVNNEDTACLVTEVRTQLENGNFATDYSILPGSPCVKFNKSKPRVKADIRLIGFGANGIVCQPKADCPSLIFKYD